MEDGQLCCSLQLQPRSLSNVSWDAYTKDGDSSGMVLHVISTVLIGLYINPFLLDHIFTHVSHYCSSERWFVNLRNIETWEENILRNDVNEHECETGTLPSLHSAFKFYHCCKSWTFSISYDFFVGRLMHIFNERSVIKKQRLVFVTDDERYIKLWDFCILQKSLKMFQKSLCSGSWIGLKN